MYIESSSTIKTLFNIIHGNIENKTKKVNPNDITILEYTLSTLQQFEAYYRYKTNEKTTTMFETYEIMFMLNINYFINNISKSPKWFKILKDYLEKNYFKEIINNNEKNKKIKNKIASLLTIYYLYNMFPNEFDEQFSNKCSDICTKDEFLKIMRNNEIEFKRFIYEVFKRNNYENIRKNKKIHFQMNTGCIKVSTIHSFKGWESEVIFLILENNKENLTSFDELLYTGITRSRKDLVVINYGNKKYDKIFRPLIDKIKE